MKKFLFITTAENFLTCYDKYSGEFNKLNQQKCKYVDKFYLLESGDKDGFDFASNKVDDLISRDGSFKNFKIVVYVNINDKDVYKNDELGDGTRTNIGYYINGTSVIVDSVAILNNGLIENKHIEDVTSMAYLVKSANMKSYQELTPRTLSYLPVKIECQASCKFCFSKSSISLDKRLSDIELSQIHMYCISARNKGAERFVITGGGEPLLLGYDGILDVLKIASKTFDNILIITNGKEIEKYTNDQLLEMQKNGLKRIAISVHDSDLSNNRKIMGLDVNYKDIFNKIKNAGIKLRLICVIQKNGVENDSDVFEYIAFAIRNRISEICFKELYVSTNIDSDYYHTKANKYCLENRVGLPLITNLMNNLNAEIIKKLPWGSPVYKLKHTYGDILVAAYTEPSVGWERVNGIARSWNLMADHNCYASLEDGSSKIWRLL